jgi:hypothetical protein
MTTSARFRLGKSAVGTSGPWTWGSYDAPIDVDPNDYIKAEFESLTGIDTASFSISSADEVVLAAGVPTVTTVPSTRTGTFRVGADPACYIVRATANPNAAGAVSSELAVHILTSASRRLIALDETDQASRTYYWLPKLNAFIRAEASVGTSAVASVAAVVSTETSTRTSADTSLTTRVSTEESAGISRTGSIDTRSSAIESSYVSLGTRISASESIVTSADASLQTRVSSEESARASAIASVEAVAGGDPTCYNVTRTSAVNLGVALARVTDIVLTPAAGTYLVIAHARVKLTATDGVTIAITYDGVVQSVTGHTYPNWDSYGCYEHNWCAQCVVTCDGAKSIEVQAKYNNSSGPTVELCGLSALKVTSA